MATLYTGLNFTGKAITLRPGDSKFTGDSPVFPNDELKSFRVSDGYHLTLSDHGSPTDSGNIKYQYWGPIERAAPSDFPADVMSFATLTPYTLTKDEKLAIYDDKDELRRGRIAVYTKGSPTGEALNATRGEDLNAKSLFKMDGQGILLIVVLVILVLVITGGIFGYRKYFAKRPTDGALRARAGRANPNQV